eukprot:NODE_321_length_9805_cov_0.700185.p2 type:complete len:557 gc:universal NODE_321_length_9805_cov_0.700185:5396-3726(-)
MLLRHIIRNRMIKSAATYSNFWYTNHILQKTLPIASLNFHTCFRAKPLNSLIKVEPLNMIQKRSFHSHQNYQKQNSYRNRFIFFLKKKRRWSTDDFLAMFSWLFLSHSFFLLVGTTSFISLLLIVLNSLQFQELIAFLVGKYITKILNATVIFESAIIPNLREGFIIFKDIQVSKSKPDEGNVKSHYYYKSQVPPFENQPAEIDYSNVNHTLYNLNFKEVKVKLSLWNFIFGKGLIKFAELKGIRGEIDKRYVDYNVENSMKFEPHSEDIVIDGLKVSDLSLNILYKDFRPIKIDVFHGSTAKFRKNWIVYDLLKSDSISGMYDNCLFSLNKIESSDVLFQKSQIKIDNLPIDLFNYGATGPLGWINEGTIDMSAVIDIPNDPEHTFVGDLKSLTKQQIQKLGIPNEVDDIPSQPMFSKFGLNFTMSLKIKDLRADMPNNMSNIFGWKTFARPLVAFLNNHHTNISFVSAFTMTSADFNGAWSIYNSNLLDSISKAAGLSLFKLYQDERLRSTKLKRLGIWSLGEVSRGLLKLFDYIRGRQDWWVERANIQKEFVY